MTSTEQQRVDPLDGCMCGHFRKEHSPGSVACSAFRLHETAAEYAARHPKHYAEVRTHLQGQAS